MLMAQYYSKMLDHGKPMPYLPARPKATTSSNQEVQPHIPPMELFLGSSCSPRCSASACPQALREVVLSNRQDFTIYTPPSSHQASVFVAFWTPVN